MSQPPAPMPAPDDAELAEIEALAIQAVEAAGAAVARRFGDELAFKVKGKDGGSPVTEVDGESQRLIAEIIAGRFPDHVFLGEEDGSENGTGDEPVARDFVWCVDPVDGTTNYLNGHPVYAVSVGVLHRGAPVAAAAWVPWPVSGGHFVIHARKGGGAWIGDRRLKVRQPSEDGRPAKNRLATIPGSLRAMFRVKVPLLGNLGEPRVTGSIVYELAMVATGVVQYALTGAAHIWDVAGGVLLVTEAGGTALTPAGRHGRAAGAWRPLDTFDPDFDTTPGAVARLRGWRGVVLAGPESVVTFVGENLEPWRPPAWRRLRGRLFSRRRRSE